MALSQQAQAIIDAAASFDFSPDFIKQTVEKMKAKRRIPSIGPGEKLVIDKHGNWIVEKVEPERFRKSGGLSPAAIELLQKMTDKSDQAEELLKACRSTSMNSAEQRQVIDATRSELTKAFTNRTARVFRWAGAPQWTRVSGSVRRKLQSRTTKCRAKRPCNRRGASRAASKA